MKGFNLRGEVWILAAGRLLSQIGTGFTLFYAPIFFVNGVGLSPTWVGIALGSASLSGVLGRFLGGTWADSPQWGRRNTLLLSTAISTLADVALGFTDNFPTLLLGNLLMGFGIGLYWPATEAAIADLTTGQQRHNAFALTRFADNLGLGFGVIFGGILIAHGGNYRLLFLIDGISFLLFFALIYSAIRETYQFSEPSSPAKQGWLMALSDRRLMTFCVVNILITTYYSQIQSTIPLYFKNVVAVGGSESGFSPSLLSSLFSFNIILTIILQLPVAQLLNRLSYPQGLMISLVFWGLGFVGVGLTGLLPSHATLIAFIALGIFSLATVSYTPFASSLVADLAPDSLRGVYLSINSQCWAIGYFIGPPLGGWVLEQSMIITHGFWFFCAATILLGLLILAYLQKILQA